VTAPEGACARCARALAGRLAFELEGTARCLRCTLRYRPLLRRSTLTALVVGTVLVAINQGNVLAAGHLPVALAWKVPLTYAVPFCVATWGALINSRVLYQVRL
jgi:hypothetical protein